MTKTKDRTIRSLEERLARKQDSLAFSRIADNYRLRGDLQHAISLCTEGLRHHPDYVTGRIVLGRCYLDQENLTDAAQEFSEVCRLDRRNLAGLKLLADIFVRQGMEDKAGALYGYLRRLDPVDGSIAKLSTTYSDTGTVSLPDIVGSMAPVYELEPAAPILSASAVVQEKPGDLETMIDELDGMLPQEQPPGQHEMTSDTVVEELEHYPGPTLEEGVSGEDISTRMDMLFGEETLPPAVTPIEAPRDFPVDVDTTPESGEVIVDESAGEISALPEAIDFSSRIEQLFGESKTPSEALLSSTGPELQTEILEQEDLLQSGPAMTSDLVEAVAESYADSEIAGNDIVNRIEELFAEEPLPTDGLPENPPESVKGSSPALLAHEDLPGSDTPTQIMDILALRGAIVSPDAPTEVINLQEIAALRQADDHELSPPQVDDGDAVRDLVLPDGDGERPTIGELPTVALDRASDEETVIMPPVVEEITALFNEEEIRHPGGEAPTVEIGRDNLILGDEVSSRIDELFPSEPVSSEDPDSIVPPRERPLDVITVSADIDGASDFSDAFPVYGIDGERASGDATEQDGGPDAYVSGDETMTQEIDVSRIPRLADVGGQELDELDFVMSEIPEETPGDVPTGEDIVRTIDAVLEEGPPMDAPETLSGESPLSALPTAGRDLIEPALTPDPLAPPTADAKTLEDLDQLADFFAAEPDSTAQAGVPTETDVGTGPDGLEDPLFLGSVLSDREIIDLRENGTEFDTPFEDLAPASDEAGDAGVREAEAADELPALVDEEESGQPDERDRQTHAIPDHVLTPTLADIYCQQGQTRLAIDIYDRLLERDPDNERLQKRLEKLRATLAEEMRLAALQSPGPIAETIPKPVPRRRARNAEKKTAAGDDKPLKGIRIKRQYRDRLRKRNG